MALLAFNAVIIAVEQGGREAPTDPTCIRGLFHCVYGVQAGCASASLPLRVQSVSM